MKVSQRRGTSFAVVLNGLAAACRLFVCVFMVTGVVASCDRRTPSPITNRRNELPRLAPNAPVDHVVERRDPGSDPEFQRLVNEARSQLPSVRARFLAGLPAGHHLFVTTTLISNHEREQVFVAVRDWSNPDLVNGLLSSTPRIAGFRAGDLLHVQTSEVLDWTISRPDGSEEGNVVGKFIERNHGSPVSSE